MKDEIPKPPKVVVSTVSLEGFTKGNEYIVSEIWGFWDAHCGYGFVIKDEEGFISLCMEKNCSYQDSGNWIIKEREL